MKIFSLFLVTALALLTSACIGGGTSSADGLSFTRFGFTENRVADQDVATFLFEVQNTGSEEITFAKIYFYGLPRVFVTPYLITATSPLLPPSSSGAPGDRYANSFAVSLYNTSSGTSIYRIPQGTSQTYSLTARVVYNYTSESNSVFTALTRDAYLQERQRGKEPKARSILAQSNVAPIRLSIKTEQPIVFYTENGVQKTRVLFLIENVGSGIPLASFAGESSEQCVEEQTVCEDLQPYSTFSCEGTRDQCKSSPRNTYCEWDGTDCIPRACTTWNTEENKCTNAGCTWEGRPSSCTGTPNYGCFAATNSEECTSVGSFCSWSGSTCRERSCSTHVGNQENCQAADCSWDGGVPSSCSAPKKCTTVCARTANVADLDDVLPLVDLNIAETNKVGPLKVVLDGEERPCTSDPIALFNNRAEVYCDLQISKPVLEEEHQLTATVSYYYVLTKESSITIDGTSVE